VPRYVLVTSGQLLCCVVVVRKPNIVVRPGTPHSRPTFAFVCEQAQIPEIRIKLRLPRKLPCAYLPKLTAFPQVRHSVSPFWASASSADPRCKLVTYIGKFTGN